MQSLRKHFRSFPGPLRRVGVDHHEQGVVQRWEVTGKGSRGLSGARVEVHELLVVHVNPEVRKHENSQPDREREFQRDDQTRMAPDQAHPADGPAVETRVDLPVHERTSIRKRSNAEARGWQPSRLSGKHTASKSFAVLAVALAIFLARPLPVLAEEIVAAVGIADEELLIEGIEAEFEEVPASFPDPLERPNRGIFRFNQGVDDWVFNPIARTYAFVIPLPARCAVRRFLENLNSPGVLVNDLLQQEWKAAGVTTGRFAVNSTVGIGGLFDPATALGLEGHCSDFGQTLALAGVPSGPYLMVPIFGPTTMRDGVGTLMDVLFRPTTYLLGPGDQLFYNAMYGGSVGVSVREQNAAGLRMLKISSIDYYAALRNAYYQSRRAEIWRRPH